MGRASLLKVGPAAGTSPDNVISYYLASPDATVAATGSTPDAGG